MPFKQWGFALFRLLVKQSGLALIDTGAGGTCVDDTAAKGLGLPVVDVIATHSASHSNVPTNVYPIDFGIANAPAAQFQVPRCAGSALPSQGLLLLIGRDILARCVLVYVGQTGTWNLSF